MGEYSIDWQMLNINRSDIAFDDRVKVAANIKELTKINQSVLYEEVSSDVNLEYILAGTSIKENIIIGKYSSNNIFTFEYKTKGLEMKKDDEENIIFVNENGKTVFSFEQLYMIDAKGETSTNIRVNFTMTGNKTYLITIIPDDTWLRTAAYPVTVDPSLVSAVTNFSIYDTYISESDPNTKYYNQQLMYVSGSTSTTENRGLLYFTIPSDVMTQSITYARLVFTKNSLVTGKQINLYKNTETFSSSSATWYNAPEFDDTSVIDYYIANTQTPMMFDITEAVKEWQATGIRTTTGFTITQDGWYGDIMSVFQVYTGSSNCNPVITIGYQDPSGLKDYWTYTSQEMGRIGSGYISDYSGNLTWVRNEYNLDHEYLPMTLSFYHNNFTRSDDIGYGDGWRTNYNIQVKKDDSLIQYYMLKPDGSRLYFANDTRELIGGDVYKHTSIAEDGLRMTLERMVDTGFDYEMTISTVDGLSYFFNGDGRLTSIYNEKLQQSIQIIYIDSTSQMIDYVYDEADNRIDFTYDENDEQLIQTELQLKQVDSTLRGVEKREYHYDSYNNISYIYCYYRYGTGENIDWTPNNFSDRLYYSFDSENRLIYAYDTNNVYKVEYSYDSKNRIDNYVVTDGGLFINNTAIEYEPSRTIFDNYVGTDIYYTFDNYGHTINIIDNKGNSTYYRYSTLFSYDYDITNQENGFDIINAVPNYYNVNNLIESSEVIKQQQNPLNNHGFEEQNTGWTLYQGTDGQICYTTSEHVLGDYSLSITKNTSSVYAKQYTYLKAGSYTISGWIKNNGTNAGAYIDVIGETYSGTITQVLNSDEWHYYSLTFTITSNASVEIRLINNSISTAFFDNIQLMEGFVETRYNAINNNSFEEGMTSWAMSGASIVTNYEDGIMDDILGKKAASIIGNGTTNQYLSQSISGLVTNGETYVVGGWAKADAVPNKAFYSYYELDDDRFFGLYISAYITSGEHAGETWKFYLPFNSSVEEWQYQMTTFTVPEYAVNIYLYIVYQGEGTAYFDNIQLYHDKLSTSFGYDADNGNLLTIQDPSEGTTNIEYGTNNNVTEVEKNGIVVDIGRNATYQVEEVTMNNVRATLEYDSATKQLIASYIGYDKNASEQDKWFKTSTYYTTDGQYISAVKDEFGNIISTVTDQSVGLIETIIDAMGNSQGFEYDAYGNLISTINTDTSSNETMEANYEYDDYGRLIYLHRDGYTYQFDYNTLDQVTSVVIANTTAMSYDYVEITEGGVTYYTNLLQQQTYGNGDYVSFLYTDEKLIQSISFNGTTRFEYEYDSSGRLSIYKDIYNSDIFFYSYDLAGRIRTITDQDGNEIRYTYDTSGNVNGYEYVIGTITRGVEYHYNLSTGIYDYTTYDVGSTEITKSYNYDNDSLKRLNNITLTIGSVTLTKIIGYDDGNVDQTMGNATTRIHSIVYTKNDTQQAIYTYQYDANNNITGLTVKNENNQVVDDYDYYYDGFNQLVRENVSINSGSFSRTYLYSYDDQGNITRIADHAYTLSNPVITTPMVLTYYEYSNTWKDQLTKITEYTNFVKTKEISYSYDANGNPTTITDLMNSYQTKTLNWDGRQLSSMSYYCGGMSFKYNDQGNRTYKSIGGCSGGYSVNYVLDGSRILSETKGTSTIYYTYDADGTLISMNYNGNEYFYITNMQGDVIQLVDINGTIVVEYKYDAWGNIIYQTPNQTIGNINPFRYRSYYYDIETGWYYLQSRYYNPSIGRFISADGLVGELGNIQSHNMYAYCANNPVLYTDITGASIDWDGIWVGVAAVAIAIVVVATVAAITVASGGTALPVIVGALIGAGVGGGISAGLQYATTGSINIGQVLLDASVGGVMGAFGGSAISRLGMTLAGCGTGFMSSIGSDMISGNDISWGKAFGAAALGGVLAFVSGPGAQYNQTGARSAALETRKLIIDRYNNGGYASSSQYTFGLHSNWGRVTRATSALNQYAITQVLISSYYNAYMQFYLKLLY